MCREGGSLFPWRLKASSEWKKSVTQNENLRSEPYSLWTCHRLRINLHLWKPITWNDRKVLTGYEREEGEREKSTFFLRGRYHVVHTCMLCYGLALSYALVEEYSQENSRRPGQKLARATYMIDRRQSFVFLLNFDLLLPVVTAFLGVPKTRHLILQKRLKTDGTAHRDQESLLAHTTYIRILCFYRCERWTEIQSNPS